MAIMECYTAVLGLAITNDQQQIIMAANINNLTATNVVIQFTNVLIKPMTILIIHPQSDQGSLWECPTIGMRK